MSLFDLPDPTNEPPLSADRRRTLARQSMLDRGQHPTGLGKVDAAHKCGECRFRFPNAGHARTYWKCLWLGPTNGPGTDIRLSWPACPLFEAGDVMDWDDAKAWSAHRPPVRRLVEEMANR